MSSGEADAIRVPRGSIDLMATCGVDGCFTRILGDTFCDEHGGHPLESRVYDPWGVEDGVALSTAVRWSFDDNIEG